MKKILIGILLIVLQISCSKKDKNSSEITLNQKWKIYTTVIVKMDDDLIIGLGNIPESHACEYKTQISDLYYLPFPQRCDNDDIYDFTQPNKLTITHGNKKCLSDEPDKESKYYERREDSIITDNFKYNIVLLSKDTLILDYCTDNNTYPPGVFMAKAKIGIKFTRLK